MKYISETMSKGYRSVLDLLLANTETDLGVVFMHMVMNFNESVPSSLGNITSFGMMGMAKKLKGKKEASLADLVVALALKASVQEEPPVAFAKAAGAALEGSESTRNMRSIQGRAV